MFHAASTGGMKQTSQTSPIGYRQNHKNKMIRKILLISVIAFSFISCKYQSDSEEEILVDAPAQIAERAYNFALLYRDSPTEYFYGGQDPVRRLIKIDCSGLVIMCYKYAMVDTQYSLIEPDMTASYMHDNATRKILMDQLRKGDLIFMGEPDSKIISHIALFEKIENEEIYFIDSTQKNSINGVTTRHYSTNDERFKSFGIMKLQVQP